MGRGTDPWRRRRRRRLPCSRLNGGVRAPGSAAGPRAAPGPPRILNPEPNISGPLGPVEMKKRAKPWCRGWGTRARGQGKPPLGAQNPEHPALLSAGQVSNSQKCSKSQPRSHHPKQLQDLPAPMGAGRGGQHHLGGEEAPGTHQQDAAVSRALRAAQPPGWARRGMGCAVLPAEIPTEKDPNLPITGTMGTASQCPAAR